VRTRLLQADVGGSTGQPPKSCVMIIKPNDFVVEIHDRMPVLLTGE